MYHYIYDIALIITYFKIFVNELVLVYVHVLLVHGMRQCTSKHMYGCAYLYRTTCLISHMHMQERMRKNTYRPIQ